MWPTLLGKLLPPEQLDCKEGFLKANAIMVNKKGKETTWRLCKQVHEEYHISSPISLVNFSIFDTEIWEIFHEKRGSAYDRGFGIQKQLLNSVVLLSLFGQHESDGRSLTFRVSAHSEDWLKVIGEEIRYTPPTIMRFRCSEEGKHVPHYNYTVQYVQQEQHI